MMARHSRLTKDTIPDPLSVAKSIENCQVLKASNVFSDL